MFVAFFGIVTFLCLVPIFTYVYFAADLSSKEKLVNHNDTGLVLLDYKDRPFFTFYQAKVKEEVTLSEVPKYATQAIIAMEDKDFYSHPGFSVKAILRAMIDDLKGQAVAYGGSTLTQQLVKNALLTPNRSFLRKYQEIVLAQEIERRYSKSEILEMYVNSVYFGEGSFGIEEATNTYFNKDAKNLDLAESAILAGILPAPSRFDLSNGDFSEAKVRQKLVLDRMVEQKMISRQDEEKALAEDLEVKKNNSDLNKSAPHFALMVRNQLIKDYGEETVLRSGFKVKTTLDLDLQKYAEKSVADHVAQLKPNRVTNGAAVVMDPRSGEVRALVGSANWYDDSFGKVNVAISPRPPGSSFKPIIYIRAFEKGLITPATILMDVPTSFANFDEAKYYASWPTRAAADNALKSDPNAYYKPLNYDRRFRGPVTVRRALANSLNVPAVAVMKKVGVEDGIDFAKDLGISTLKDPSNYGLSLVLGTADVKLLELTDVYATFANKGYRNDPVLISQIVDKNGQTVYQYQPNPEKVIDEEYTFLISSILSDNKTRAEEFGNALNISRPAAVKTGTTEDFKDAWTLGYTPSVTVGVWVGNNFGQPMDNVAGSLGAAPIWKDLMEKALKGTPIERFDPPDGVVKLTTCGVDLSGKQATSAATLEYFVKGTEPRKTCILPSPTPAPSGLTVPTVTSPSPIPTPSAASSPTSPTPSPTQPGTDHVGGPGGGNDKKKG